MPHEGTRLLEKTYESFLKNCRHFNGEHDWLSLSSDDITALLTEPN